MPNPLARRAESAPTLSGPLLALAVTLAASVPALFAVSSPVSATMVTVISATAIILAGTASRPVYGEPIALLAVLWFLAAGLPVLAPAFYASDWYRSRVPSELWDTSARWMYRAWAAIAIGWWIARIQAKVVTPRVPTGRLAQQERTFEFLLGTIGCVGIVGTIVLGRGTTFTFAEAHTTEASSVGQVVSYLQTCGLVYLFAVAARSGSVARNFTSNRLALVNLIGALALAAISGTKGGLFAPIVALALGLAMRKQERSTPLKDFALCVAGFAGVYVISVAVTAYRIQLLNTPLPSSDDLVELVLFQVSLFFSAAYSALVGTTDASPDLLSRFSHVTGLALVLQVSNEVSPHQGASATFLTPIYAIIPRDWLPIKEVFFNSGQMAGLMGWSFGGLSTTLPGSIYWALGYGAIAPVCLGLGWLLARLREAAERGRSRAIARLVFLPFTLAMLDVGTDFHPMIINSTRFFLLGLLLLFVARVWQGPSVNMPAYRVG